jgi:hypothetical protein
MILRRFIVGILGVLAAAGQSVAALAQGCAICYNTASAQKASAISALRHGILILAIPPVLIFLTIGVVAYCERNRSAGAEVLFPPSRANLEVDGDEAALAGANIDRAI